VIAPRRTAILLLVTLLAGCRSSPPKHFYVLDPIPAQERSTAATGTVVQVAAVNIPVQAVGGLTLEQAVRTPEYGAPLVVLGAPLTIDADAFKTASGDVESSLRLICDRVHAYGDVKVGG